MAGHASDLAFIANSGDDPSMTYPGGKGRMYQKIISLIPPHRVYVETHLGGGAVLLAKRPAEVTIGIDSDSSVIESWRPRHGDTIELVHGDACDWLERRRFRGDEFVYCDPPYPHETRRSSRIYRHELTSVGHERLLGILRSLPCDVMVSSYPNALYDRVLADWSRVTTESPSQIGLRTECLWMNYDRPIILHDHAYIGNTFRNREVIRRRREAVIRKIRRLDPTERSALLFEIAGEDPEMFRRIAAILDHAGDHATDCPERGRV